MLDSSPRRSIFVHDIETMISCDDFWLGTISRLNSYDPSTCFRWSWVGLFWFWGPFSLTDKTLEKGLCLTDADKNVGSHTEAIKPAQFFTVNPPCQAKRWSFDSIALCIVQLTLLRRLNCLPLSVYSNLHRNPIELFILFLNATKLIRQHQFESISTCVNQWFG